MRAAEQPVTGVDAVVVAAGASERMGGVDKLAAQIGGRPLLAWTLEALAAVPIVDRIVLVTSPERVAALAGAPWLPAAVMSVVAGGARRQESVAAGVAALDGNDERVVLIHDGARPAPPRDLVERVAAGAAEHGAAIPVLPVAETVKRIAGGLVTDTLDRTELAVAQTPQAARRGLLQEAWARFPPSGTRVFTDEAALLEACNIAVHAIPGDPTNLKVTVPTDLARAEAALLGGLRADSRLSTPRVGLGVDSHPFGPGGPLVLGGIVIDGAPRLQGHSDGDVALHAVADALLGAAGLGDLGRLFPAGPETPSGIASTRLLADVARRVRDAGHGPASVDVTIVAARPRLAGRLDEMRDVIAGLLDVAPGAVSVKASTGNLSGADGAGRTISAQAIVVLEPLRRVEPGGRPGGVA